MPLQKIKKFSNEFIIGILVTGAVLLAYFGYQILKGKNIFEEDNYIYFTVDKVEELQIGSNVIAKGFVIGKVENIKNMDLNLSQFLVKIKLEKDYQIPINSIFKIKKELIGKSGVQIQLGDDPRFLKPNDTVLGSGAMSFSLQILDAKDQDQMVKLGLSVLTEIEQVSLNLRKMLDPTTVQHLKASFASLENISQNLSQSTQKVNTILSNTSQELESTIRHIHTVSQSLADNSKGIENIIKNSEHFSEELKKVRVSNLADSMGMVVSNLRILTANLNNKEGIIYKLSKEAKLYNRIDSLTSHLDDLVKDVKKNPSKYIQINVFGRKK